MPINLVINGKNSLIVCINCGIMNFPEVAIRKIIPNIKIIIEIFLYKSDFELLLNFLFFLEIIRNIIATKIITKINFII